MALILCLDSATKACTVALSENGQCIAFIEHIEESYSHSEKLHLIIDEVMKKAGRSFSQLDAVAVGKGPGSYTGLRIGASAAKGICYALSIPLISIPTLKVLAARATEELKGADLILRPMLDARRMEVYSAAYSSSLDELVPCSAEIIEDGAFREELDQGQVIFFGDGMEKCRTLLSAHSNAQFIENIHPSASAMAQIALDAFDTEDFEDVAYFEPFYLKDFIAKKSKPLL